MVFLSIATATVCGCGDAQPARETVSKKSQYVVWLPANDPLVTEHTQWHLGAAGSPGARKQPISGSEFLAFHRNFLIRLRAKHESLGRDASERTGWGFLAEDSELFAVLPQSVKDAVDNVIGNRDPRHGGAPFANEEDFGLYMEEEIHNQLHGSTAVAHPSDANAIASINMSPTSTYFFKIHGFVEWIYKVFQRGKLFQTAYSDVLQRQIVAPGSNWVVQVNQDHAWTAVSDLPAMSQFNCNSYFGAVNDFDFDGNNDIVVHTPDCGGGGEEIWGMKGAVFDHVIASSGLGNLPQVDGSWRIIGSNDFNDDMKPDLVWANSAGHIAFWYMDGVNYVFSEVTSLPSGFVGQAVAGWGYIIIRNPSTGELRAQSYDRTAVNDDLNLPSVPDNDWQLVGTGHYYADGSLRGNDLLWQHIPTGTVGTWNLGFNFEVLSYDYTNFGGTTVRMQGPR